MRCIQHNWKERNTTTKNTKNRLPHNDNCRMNSSIWWCDKTDDVLDNKKNVVCTVALTTTIFPQTNREKILPNLHQGGIEKEHNKIRQKNADWIIRHFYDICTSFKLCFFFQFAQYEAKEATNSIISNFVRWSYIAFDGVIKAAHLESNKIGEFIASSILLCVVCFFVCSFYFFCGGFSLFGW